PSTADGTESRFRVTTPGAGRTVAVWLGLGLAFGGAAPSTRDFLAERWQLDSAGQAGVLGGAVLVGVLTLLVAHWWWDLSALERNRLPRVVGTAFMAAPALIAAGAWSYTYPGIIFCWMLAGAATAVGLVAFDRLVLVPAEPPTRRLLSALQPVLFGIGALAGAAIIPVAGDSGRLRILVAVVPLAVVGWRLQRGALEPAHERPPPTSGPCPRPCRSSTTLPCSGANRSTSPTAPSRCSSTCRWNWRRARRLRCSAPTAPARRPCCAPSPASCSPTPVRCG
ncbi:MAG: hypothetical protein AAGK32_15775, partial [Actinomycetota bacterium]